MIARDRDEPRIVSEPDRVSLLEIRQRLVVRAELKLAESLERPRRAVFRLRGRDLPERVAALRVSSPVVRARSEIPVTFDPPRAQAHGPPVQIDRRLELACGTCRLTRQ